MHFFDLQVFTKGCGSKRRKRMTPTEGGGRAGLRYKHGLNQPLRRREIRPHRIVHPLSIEGPHQRGDDAVVQQAVEFATRIVWQNQIGLAVKQWLGQLPNTSWRYAFELACNDATPPSVQFLSHCKGRFTCL